MTYIEEQDTANFKLGDEVIVMRTARNNERGWSNVWCDNMTLSVGEIYTVKRIVGLSGIYLSDGYSYPYFVLRKVGKEKIPDNIKVGSVLTTGGNIFIVVESIKGLVCRCRVSFPDKPVHDMINISAHDLKNYEIVKT